MTDRSNTPAGLAAAAECVAGNNGPILKSAVQSDGTHDVYASYVAGLIWLAVDRARHEWICTHGLKGKGIDEAITDAALHALSDRGVNLIEVERDAADHMMICAVCGTVETVASIKRRNPAALSCCPERQMIRVGRDHANLIAQIARMSLSSECNSEDYVDDSEATLDNIITRARQIGSEA